MRGRNGGSAAVAAAAGSGAGSDEGRWCRWRGWQDARRDDVSQLIARLILFGVVNESPWRGVEGNQPLGE